MLLSSRAGICSSGHLQLQCRRLANIDWRAPSGFICSSVWMTVCKGALRNSAYLLSCAGESFFRSRILCGSAVSMDSGANETAYLWPSGQALFIENIGCKH